MSAGATFSPTGARKTTRPMPRGVIGWLYNATLPAGYLLCDGTDGTPDLRDRIIVGATAIGTGTSGGTVSATAALTHSGAAVAAHAAHVVTQPGAHADHGVTQPATHASHVIGQGTTHATHASGGAHTHEAHTTAASTASTVSVVQSGFTHSSDGAHTHDAHAAHSGAALDAHAAHSGFAVTAHSAHTGFAVTAHDAHAVTQPASHAVPRFYLLAPIMRAAR